MYTLQVNLNYCSFYTSLSCTQKTPKIMTAGLNKVFHGGIYYYKANNHKNDKDDKSDYHFYISLFYF